MDIIEATFAEFRSKNWTHDYPYYHLYTCNFAKHQFVCRVYLPPELRSCRQYVCNEKEPRIFDSETMKKIVGPLKEGMKGFFRFNECRFHFKFELKSLMNAADCKEYKDAIEKPMLVEESTVNYTDKKDSVYVSSEEVIAVASLSDKYDTFYNKNNGWSQIKDSCPLDWKPAKPIAPRWSPLEIEIIGFFIKGGWKFAASWRYGMQYAFPHRTKSSCQGKWYEINKTDYRLEYIGRKLSNRDRILRAKKLCKAMMQEKLASGEPTRLPKPSFNTF